MKNFSPVNVHAAPIAFPDETCPSPLSPLYSDAHDRAKHLRNIESLSQETERSMQDIEPLYEDVLARMKERASIQDYLPILVSKQVKFLLSN